MRPASLCNVNISAPNSQNGIYSFTSMLVYVFKKEHAPRINDIKNIFATTIHNIYIFRKIFLSAFDPLP